MISETWLIIAALAVSLVGAVAAVAAFIRMRQHSRTLEHEVARLYRETAKLQKATKPLDPRRRRAGRRHLREIARISPPAALIAAWHEVERAVEESGESEAIARASLAPGFADLFDRLKELRNKIVHSSEDVDKATVLRMVMLAPIIADRIRGQARRRLTSR